MENTMITNDVVNESGEVQELSLRNKATINKIEDIITEYNMKWTWESIDYVLNKENVSFNTLALRDGSFKNVRILIQAGLPKARRTKEDAFKIMDILREEGINMDIVHIVLKDKLEKSHFFTDMEALDDIINLGAANIQTTMSTSFAMINTVLMSGGIDELMKR